MPPATSKPPKAGNTRARPSTPHAPTPPTRHQIPAPQSSRQAGNPSASRTRARDEAAALHGIVDLEALADRLTEQSADGPAAALMRPLLPRMLAAMIQGSLNPGPSGAADRAALAKIIGAPWSVTAADRKGGATGKTREAGKQVGGRLEAAIARRTRANGAGSDTQDEAEAGKVAPILGF